jgi:anaphase-promoting complex subunit 1
VVQSPLLNNVFDSLHYALPENIYHLVKSRFLRFHFGVTLNEFLCNDHSEWENFLIVFLSFCQKNFTSSFSLEEKQGAPIDSPWEKLLHSEYHINSSSSFPYFGKSSSHESSQRWSYLNKLSRELQFLNHNEPGIRGFLPSVLLVLHLVYEDLKLDSTRLSDLKSLARLLYQISNHIEWMEYSTHYLLEGYAVKENLIIEGCYEFPNIECISLLMIFKQDHR